MQIVASFWVRETKQGERFLAGLTKQGNRFLMFKNKKKTQEKHPDYLLYDTGDVATKDGSSDSVSAPESDKSKNLF